MIPLQKYLLLQNYHKFVKNYNGSEILPGTDLRLHQKFTFKK